MHMHYTHLLQKKEINDVSPKVQKKNTRFLTSHCVKCRFLLKVYICILTSFWMIRPSVVQWDAEQVKASGVFVLQTFRRLFHFWEDGSSITWNYCERYLHWNFHVYQRLLGQRGPEVIYSCFRFSSWQSSLCVWVLQSAVLEWIVVYQCTVGIKVDTSLHLSIFQFYFGIFCAKECKQRNTSLLF